MTRVDTIACKLLVIIYKCLFNNVFLFVPEGNVKLKVVALDYDDINVQERVDHFEYLFRSSSGRRKKYSLARKLNLTGSISR